MVKIRLARLGTKKKPFFRVIVTDSRARRNGPFVEIIGTYDPRKEAPNAVIDIEKAKYWLGNGAQPTDSVRKLLNKAGLEAA